MSACTLGDTTAIAAVLLSALTLAQGIPIGRLAGKVTAEGNTPRLPRTFRFSVGLRF